MRTSSAGILDERARPAAESGQLVILATASPNRPHRVLADRFVIRDEVQAFSDRLGDQDSVERILVQRRERSQCCHMTRADRQHRALR